MTSPVISSMRVIPVAGRDSMLLNLSGAHGPYFTRNIVLVTDNSGHTGVGEVPGGEKIRQVLEEAGSAVVGRAIASYHESSSLFWMKICALGNSAIEPM